MTVDDTAQKPTLALRQGDVAPVPVQGRRRVASSPADRIAQQLQAIDAWIADRRAREKALHAPHLTRDQRMDVAREIEVLRRTHDTIKGRCAQGLSSDTESLWPDRLTAVVAHRHAWFVDRLTLLLGAHGVTVLLGTDNGAEALGAVVAEQPEILLVGDRLAMMSSSELLGGSRRYAPGTLLAVQASDPQEADALHTDVDMVLLRHHPPGVVADALVALHLVAAGQAGGL